MVDGRPVPGIGGDRYLPYEQRTGNESIVYFTRELSAAGLREACSRVAGDITGKVAVKVHTGEEHGPNIIPPAWVRELLAHDLPGAAIVETNTYYEGSRGTTEQHRRALRVNGWDFAPVDILDEWGTALLPVTGGTWFREMSVGVDLLNYDSLLALTHFKGHALGGFGGANKNIGIGCADGRIGKAWIHTPVGTDDQWGIGEEEFMERMTESSKAVLDRFGRHVAFVNVMRNMSVSCDCEGVGAQPVVTPDVGILASTDMLAVDQACIDLVHAMTEDDRHDLVERIESRHGLRQLSRLKELGMGNDRYVLLDMDHDDARIRAADAVAGVRPFGG